MKAVGRKCMDNTSRAMIDSLEEAVDDHIEKIGEWGKCEEMLELADDWMGKRNRLPRLVVDWKLVQDECGEHKKKKKESRSSEMNVEQVEDGFGEEEKCEEETSVVSFMLKDPVVLCLSV